jgi:hypothetical protein
VAEVGAHEKRLFKLLDKYARSAHSYFLAEMTSTDEGCSLCFRPVCGDQETDERYACRYLVVGTGEACLVSSNGLLTANVISWLDGELPTLSRVKG